MSKSLPSIKHTFANQSNQGAFLCRNRSNILRYYLPDRSIEGIQFRLLSHYFRIRFEKRLKLRVIYHLFFDLRSSIFLQLFPTRFGKKTRPQVQTGQCSQIRLQKLLKLCAIFHRRFHQPLPSPVRKSCPSKATKS